MSKKSKGVVFDLKTPHGIGMYEDAKTRLKYQTLMQDYEELQKDADVMRSKLDSSKQRKLMLAAEVRFLRRRYKYLVTTKNTNSSQELSPVKASLKKRGKITKEKLLIGKEGSQHRLPLIPEPNSKKKQNPLRESFPVSDQPRKKKSYKGHGLSLISSQVSDLNHKGRTNVMKEVAVPNMIPILDRNQKERISGANDATLCHPIVAFDLNQVTTTFIEKETLPTRAPVFDLNEISTEDEEFHGNFEANKVEEGGKSLIRGINEGQPSDMKLSICRNVGESCNTKQLRLVYELREKLVRGERKGIWDVELTQSSSQQPKNSSVYMYTSPFSCYFDLKQWYFMATIPSSYCSLLSHHQHATRHATS